MNKTFQSFVFGCRVNEAERMKIDRELIEAGYTVYLTSPSFLIINTCAITGKAEREARQLINQLRKKYPQAHIVVTGCSATLWKKYQTGELKLANIFVPNEEKSNLVRILTTHLATCEVAKANLADASADKAQIDKFRRSNRLLVKIQDGCHRFCSYCIVPYLRGNLQSVRIADIVSYINSYLPTPSEVVLSAVNTESFGKDTGETLVDLIKAILKDTIIPRIAFGSIHPWSLTDEFIDYYKRELSQNPRFIHFFHVPIQSGSQTILKTMRREYNIQEVIQKLHTIQTIQPNALIATDVIVGYLGETDELFEETYTLLTNSPISRFHVFRFSNRPHTAAWYIMRSKDKADCRVTSKSEVPRNDINIFEPTAEEKRKRSARLLELSKNKLEMFLSTQLGRSCEAFMIAKQKNGYKLLLDNHVEGYSEGKQCLPGQIVHVTIRAAKDGVVVCKES